MMKKNRLEATLSQAKKFVKFGEKLDNIVPSGVKCDISIIEGSEGIFGIGKRPKTVYLEANNVENGGEFNLTIQRELMNEFGRGFLKTEYDERTKKFGVIYEPFANFQPERVMKVVSRVIRSKAPVERRVYRSSGAN